jgi:MurNAc alpha-1-phosphate uridylyltransferase
MPESLKFPYLFVLAAGLGTRMGALTKTTPKPLLSVRGKPILGHILDNALKAEIKAVAVNIYHLGVQITDFLATQTQIPIYIYPETQLLETGGGVKAAMQQGLGDIVHHNPFFICNGDTVWHDKPSADYSVFQYMESVWDVDKMDILLLLAPLAHGQKPDYYQDTDGRLIRTKQGELHDLPAFFFIGLRLVSPHIFDYIPKDAFSFLEYFDKAESEKRLYGAVYQGEYSHYSTAEDLL